MIPLKYNARNLVVRKRTTLAAAFGLALVVFVFASARMLSEGIKKTLGRAADPNVAVVLRKGSDSELTSIVEDNARTLVLDFARQVGASKVPTGVGEIVTVILLDKLGTTGVSNVTVRGVPTDALAFHTTVKVVDGRAPNPGADEVLVGTAIRGRFRGLELGSTFDLKKNRPVKVVGFFSDEGSATESEVWADIELVKQAFKRDGHVSSVRVRLDGPSKFDGFKALLEDNRQLGVTAMREADFLEKQSEMTGFILNLLGGMVAIFFSAGAMIGATITMNAQVAGRTREIGTLRALGFSKSSILVSFLFESLLLSLFGGAVGALAATAMKAVKISMINGNSWSEIVFGFEPTPGIIAGSMILATVMGLVGGFLPAIRATRVSPLEALRG